MLNDQRSNKQPGRFKKVVYFQVEIERYGGKISFHVHKKS